MEDIERDVVCVISERGGSMSAEDLLIRFRRVITPGGRVNKVAYFDFMRVVKKVAIKHESDHFGPSWILKKPPRRGC